MWRQNNNNKKKKQFNLTLTKSVIFSIGAHAETAAAAAGSSK